MEGGKTKIKGERRERGIRQKCRGRRLGGKGVTDVRKRNGRGEEETEHFSRYSEFLSNSPIRVLIYCILCPNWVEYG